MKRKVIEEMRAQRDMSEAEAGRAFDEVFTSIENVLDRGERVTIQGFGTFSRKYRDTRTGRNPRTGEPVTVQGRDVTKFKEARQRTR